MRFPRIRNPFEHRIRRFDSDEVTSTEGGELEVDPIDVGLQQADVDAIWSGVVGLYKTRLYPAIALCVRRKGQVLLDRAIGHARGNAPDDAPDAETIQATPRTLFNLFSATKMVTAMMIHLLDQRRLVHLDDPVAHYVPEFGTHGKEWITLRHVLTHRAGIPRIPSEHATVEILSQEQRILELLYEAKPTSVAGRRLAYHALTGGWVLGEIIRRVTGKSIREFLHDEIAEPLGFDQFNYGVPAERVGEVALNAYTGPPLIPPASALFKRILGVSFLDAIRFSNDARFLTAVVPAGNVITTANEASRFMQLLVQGGEMDGHRIYEAQTIVRATAEQSYLEMDLTLGAPIRYGMGFMLGADYFSIYGLKTHRAFGHLGFTNVVMYADPERDIAVSLMTSGKPFLAPGVVRWLGLFQTIARRIPRDWGR